MPGGEGVKAALGEEVELEGAVAVVHPDSEALRLGLRDCEGLREGVRLEVGQGERLGLRLGEAVRLGERERVGLGVKLGVPLGEREGAGEREAAREPVALPDTDRDWQGEEEKDA